MAAEPHHRQVQERGGAALPDPGRGGERGVVHRGQVRPVRLEIAEARHGGGRGADPARRRPHADADPVVLDHQQQRQREMLVSAVRRGVDRPGRGRVVQGRVAEAGGHDRIRGPLRGPAEPGGPVQGEGQAESAGQVRGDRRGLRDDVQQGMAEHLVAAARDGLVRRGDQAEQDVRDPVPGRRGLLAPGQVEGARAVVQQGRVGDPQRRGDAGVALVPGRPDRVVPGILGPQPARGQIEVAAGQLRVEELQAALPGQGRAVPDGVRPGGTIPRAAWGIAVQRADHLAEMALDCVPFRRCPPRPAGACPTGARSA